MKYRTIVADPPWPVNTSFWNEDMEYSLMDMEWINALPIKDIVAKDAVLWLWCLASNIPEARGTLEAWGFQYSQTVVWCKTPKPSGPRIFGHNWEPLLIGKRGKIDAREHYSTSWFNWPVGRHSAKPDAFYDLVEATTHGPFAEIFSRRSRMGWDSWGNEVACTVEGLEPA